MFLRNYIISVTNRLIRLIKSQMLTPTTHLCTSLLTFTLPLTIYFLKIFTFPSALPSFINTPQLLPSMYSKTHFPFLWDYFLTFPLSLVNLRIAWPFFFPLLNFKSLSFLTFRISPFFHTLPHFPFLWAPLLPVSLTRHGLLPESTNDQVQTRSLGGGIRMEI